MFQDSAPNPTSSHVFNIYQVRDAWQSQPSQQYQQRMQSDRPGGVTEEKHGKTHPRVYRTSRKVVIKNMIKKIMLRIAKKCETMWHVQMRNMEVLKVSLVNAMRKPNESESEWVSWCIENNETRQSAYLYHPVPFCTTSSLRAFRVPRSIKAHDTAQGAAGTRLFFDLWLFLTSWSKANLKQNQHTYNTKPHFLASSEIQLSFGFSLPTFSKDFNCMAMSSAVQVAMVHWALSSVAQC